MAPAPTTPSITSSARIRPTRPRRPTPPRPHRLPLPWAGRPGPTRGSTSTTNSGARPRSTILRCWSTARLIRPSMVFPTAAIRIPKLATRTSTIGQSTTTSKPIGPSSAPATTVSKSSSRSLPSSSSMQAGCARISTMWIPAPWDRSPATRSRLTPTRSCPTAR